MEIPDSFGNEVEIIVLSNADEKTNSYENRELLNVEDRIWSELSVKDFFSVILKMIQFMIKVNPNNSVLL